MKYFNQNCTLCEPLKNIKNKQKLFIHIYFNHCNDYICTSCKPFKKFNNKKQKKIHKYLNHKN